MMAAEPGTHASHWHLGHRTREFAKPLFVTLLLAAIAVFYGLTMRPGELGTDDSAQYIQHAKNLSDGAPYGTIPWVYHADGWNPGPRAYPPMFPLFLAPLYHEFGLNLQVMHFLTLAFFVAALAIIYLTFRVDLGFPGVLALIAIIGFNPYFWYINGSILSDIPFFCLCYLTLLMVEKAVSREDSGAPYLGYSVLTGIVLYIACGTRVVGISMIPAIVGWSLVRRRKIAKTIGIIATIGIVLEGVEAVTLRTFQSYSKNFARETHATLSLSWIAGEARTLGHYWLGSMATLWSNGRSRHLMFGFFAFTLIVALVGFGVQISRKIRVHEAFALFYLPALFYWMEIRYLIPIIPLYLFYAILGMIWLLRRTPAWCSAAAYSGLLVVVAVTYASEYHYGKPAGSLDVASPQAQEMFGFVKNEMTSADVIESVMPRVVSLYTGRKSSEYDYAPDTAQTDVQQYFCRTGITYVLASKEVENRWFSDFVQSNRDSWSVVYSNPMFNVYQVPNYCRSANRDGYE